MRCKAAVNKVYGTPVVAADAERGANAYFIFDVEGTVKDNAIIGAVEGVKRVIAIA